MSQAILTLRSSSQNLFVSPRALIYIGRCNHAYGCTHCHRWVWVWGMPPRKVWKLQARKLYFQLFPAISSYKPCIFVYCLLYISVVKFLPMIIVYSKRSITQIHNIFHFPKTITLVKPMAVSRKKEKCISTLHAMMTQWYSGIACMQSYSTSPAVDAHPATD
jgi:hypothetical protein